MLAKRSRNVIATCGQVDITSAYQKHRLAVTTGEDHAGESAKSSPMIRWPMTTRSGGPSSRKPHATTWKGRSRAPSGARINDEIPNHKIPNHKVSRWPRPARSRLCGRRDAASASPVYLPPPLKASIFGGCICGSAVPDAPAQTTPLAHKPNPSGRCGLIVDNCRVTGRAAQHDPRESCVVISHG